MERRTLLGILLIVVALPLLAMPATMSVEPYQYHETTPTLDAFNESGSVNESRLESNVATVVAYQNLSERGQELYTKSLENDGRITFPVGEGAPDFEYLSEADVSELPPSEAYKAGTVIVKRPIDTDLPAPDENSNDTRYDFMAYGQEKPDFPSEEHVPQVVLPILGFCALAGGAYLISNAR